MSHRCHSAQATLGSRSDRAGSCLLIAPAASFDQSACSIQPVADFVCASDDRTAAVSDGCPEYRHSDGTGKKNLRPDGSPLLGVTSGASESHLGGVQMATALAAGCVSGSSGVYSSPSRTELLQVDRLPRDAWWVLGFSWSSSTLAPVLALLPLCLLVLQRGQGSAFARLARLHRWLLVFFALCALAPVAEAFETSLPPAIAARLLHGRAARSSEEALQVPALRVSAPAPPPLASAHARQLVTTSPPRRFSRSLELDRGRRLQATLVTTVEGLTAALEEDSVSHVLLAAGTYAFTSAMCSLSALCISRSVIIEASEPGTVVLDAQGSSSNSRRVMAITSGSVELIGLNMTGGIVTVSAGICF